MERRRVPSVAAETVSVVRVASARRERVEDEVAVEEPLEIRIDGDTFAVTMRTPGHDLELVAGLLFAEGLITSRHDLGSMTHCGRLGDEGARNVVEVTPAPGSRLAVAEWDANRRTVVTSACGICGRVTIHDLVERLGVSADATRFESAFLAELPARLAEKQPNFARTGGLHAAGAASPGGGLELVREDVGRHNAVDKVVGRLLLDGHLPMTGQALVVSGRASFEIIQKAVTARFSAVASVSAPSSLAVAMAARFDLMLLGFVRGGDYNIYSGASRII